MTGEITEHFPFVPHLDERAEIELKHDPLKSLLWKKFSVPQLPKLGRYEVKEKLPSCPLKVLSTN